MKTIKYLTLIGVNMAMVFGQQLTFGPPTLGELQATVPIKITSPPTTPSAAVEFTISNLPQGVVVSAAGGAALAGNKSLACNTTGGKIACIASGGQTNIPDGDVAVLNVTAPTTMQVPLALSAVNGASPSADAVTFTAGTAISPTLKSSCDLNGDGVTNVADVTVGVLQSLGVALGLAQCTSLDISKRGKCDSVDVQRVINASVAGGSCRVGQ